MFAEANEEKFVLWIGGFEKLIGGLLGLVQFVGHAAAEIQDDADGDGNIFRGKIHDFLLDVVFEDAEIVGLQTCDQAVVRVGDGNVDKRQFHVEMHGSALLNDLTGCVVSHVVGDEGLGEGGRQ